jgi:hypothetical protein
MGERWDLINKSHYPTEKNDRYANLMENPDNEDIIIPLCILLIAAGIQQYRGNCFGRLWVRPWIARRN